MKNRFEGIKSKVYILLCALALVYGLRMFASVNKVVVEEVYMQNGGAVESAVDNAQKHGQIYLHIDGASSDNEVRLLVNGASGEGVTQSEKVLDVFDGCVVELDTRGAKEPVMLRVTGTGANVYPDCTGRVVTGFGDIQNIGTFIIKNTEER